MANTLRGLGMKIADMVDDVAAAITSGGTSEILSFRGMFDVYSGQHGSGLEIEAEAWLFGYQE